MGFGRVTVVTGEASVDTTYDVPPDSTAHTPILALRDNLVWAIPSCVVVAVNSTACDEGLETVGQSRRLLGDDKQGCMTVQSCHAVTAPSIRFGERH